MSRRHGVPSSLIRRNEFVVSAITCAMPAFSNVEKADLIQVRA